MSIEEGREFVQNYRQDRKKIKDKKINDFVKQGIKFLGIKRKLIIPLIVPTEY